MIIGVLDSPPGSSEARVLLTPRDARSLVRRGGEVLIQSGAGRHAGFSDAAYESIGARVIHDREGVLRRSDVLLSVMIPSLKDAAALREGAVLLGLFFMDVEGLAFAAAAEASGARVVSLVEVTDATGRQPFRERMAEIGGALCATLAARLLEIEHSRGVLLGGVPGVPPAAVVIVGAGVLGRSAARAFSGLGATVTVLDVDHYALESLTRERLQNVSTVVSSPAMLERSAAWADVLIGAVRVDDGPLPRLLLPSMGKPGAVWLDMSIDEGGCIEGSRPVSGVEGAYLDHGVLCCPVPNLPSQVARTSSHVLSGLVSPRLRAMLAGRGLEESLR